MTKSLLIALAIVLSAPAAAQNSVEVHGISHHYGARKGEYNERNLGIGYRRQVAQDMSLGVHAYENSYSNRAFNDQSAKRRIAVGAVLEYTPIHLGPVAAGAGAGLVTGYPQCAICPGGYLLARAGYGGAEVTVRGVPRIPNITVGIVAVSVGLAW
jgi:hypothetical protein